MVKTITPSEKDFERAKKLYRNSDAQMKSNINRIKDPFKVANRGIAYHTLYRYGYRHPFTHRLEALSASPELMAAYTHTMETIDKNYLEQDKIRAAAKRLREKPSIDIFEKKITNKVSKWSRNQILNALFLNKKCFGDEIRITKIKYKFNHYPGFGMTNTPCRIVFEFEHLSGYFFRDMDYALIFDVKFDGDKAIAYKTNGRTFCTFGIKDSHTLKENFETIKNFEG